MLTVFHSILHIICGAERYESQVSRGAKPVDVIASMSGSVVARADVDAVYAVRGFDLDVVE
jgi:hypothetical protein